FFPSVLGCLRTRRGFSSLQAHTEVLMPKRTFRCAARRPVAVRRCSPRGSVPAAGGLRCGHRRGRPPAGRAPLERCQSLAPRPRGWWSGGSTPGSRRCPRGAAPSPSRGGASSTARLARSSRSCGRTSRTGPCTRGAPGRIPTCSRTTATIPTIRTLDLGFTHKSAGLRAVGSMAVKSKPPPAAPRPGSVVFVGYAEFDMDGRTFTAGEMDRLMMHSAVSKYPCARPATFDEYIDQAIVGLPKKNASGRDIVFVGPGGTGCELHHTNTLGSQKCAVPPGEALDGTWGLASMYGRKSILCVYPVERVKRQQSLTQFGLCRATLNGRGQMRPSQSLTALSDKTMWASTGFARSTSEAQSTSRMDQFFR
ncbi:unnamed protein product, partial [Prorocentrum cordatum]